MQNFNQTLFVFPYQYRSICYSTDDTLENLPSTSRRIDQMAVITLNVPNLLNQMRLSTINVKHTYKCIV